MGMNMLDQLLCGGQQQEYQEFATATTRARPGGASPTAKPMTVSSRWPRSYRPTCTSSRRSR